MKIAAKHERIVSLAPSVTSILVALGARRHLVGVSKWCKDVAEVRGLPTLGDCWHLNPGEVWALRPTLVIASVPYQPETVAKLLARPINFLATWPRTLSDIYSDILLLGRITGRLSRALQITRKMQREFRAITMRARGVRRRPRVYCETWPDPRISSQPWVAEMVRIAGGTFVLPAGERITDEQVAQARPDVIILAWAATGDRADINQALELPAWRNIPAVRERRVYVLRDELLNTPALPLVQGAKKLFEILHPDLARP